MAIGRATRKPVRGVGIAQFVTLRWWAQLMSDNVARWIAVACFCFACTIGRDAFETIFQELFQTEDNLMAFENAVTDETKQIKP